MIDKRMRCPLCDGTSFRPIYLYHEAFMKKFEKLICKHCSLVQIYPMLTQEEVERLYSIDYFQEDYRCGTPKSYYQAIVDIQDDFKKRILPLIQRHSGAAVGLKALEIGCAGGAGLKVLHEAGFEVYGVELNPQIAEWGRKHLNVDIRVGTLEKVMFPNAFFDVVYMGDVLEHVLKPIEFLSEIWRVTSENAFLIIDIPFEMNAILPKFFYGMLSPLLFLLYGYERRSPYPPYHAFVYNPRTVSALLEKTGFKMISLRQTKILRLLTWKVIFDVPNFLLTKILNVLGDRATIVARKSQTREVRYYAHSRKSPS